MKASLSAIVSVLVAAALWAAPAAAVEMTVAGWDFSQYLGAGVLSTDGSTFTSTLSANYSEWDATGNAGADAAMYGTMYMDCSFGSTNVSAGSERRQRLRRTHAARGRRAGFHEPALADRGECLLGRLRSRSDPGCHHR